MNFISKTILFSTLFAGTLLTNTTFAESVSATASKSTNSTEEEQPRWFEIEVILYKLNSNDGLTNESWSHDTPFQLEENLIDFLQPMGFSEEDQATIDTNKLKEADNKLELQIIKQPEKNALDTNEIIPQEPEVSPEQAFLTLDPLSFRLLNEAKAISVNSKYQLVSHFAWRQPVSNRTEATSVRVAGGHDYQERFDFYGNKKLETFDSVDLSETDETTESATSDENPLNLNGNLNESTAANIIEPDSHSFDLEQDITADQIKTNLPISAEPEMIPLAWVPEVDGRVQVYIHRNYLHVDADLVYRLPGKEELDIFTLGSQFSPLDNLGTLNESTIFPIDEKENELTQTAENNPSDSYSNGNHLDEMALEKNTNSSDISNDFSWQYDGEFLNEDSEKTIIEKLINYPLKQNRRLRSTELHYFDHPLIGMLVIITPYEIDSISKTESDTDLDPESEFETN